MSVQQKTVSFVLAIRRLPVKGELFSFQTETNPINWFCYNYNTCPYGWTATNKFVAWDGREVQTDNVTETF